MNMLSEV